MGGIEAGTILQEATVDGIAEVHAPIVLLQEALTEAIALALLLVLPEAGVVATVVADQVEAVLVPVQEAVEVAQDRAAPALLVQEVTNIFALRENK